MQTTLLERFEPLNVCMCTSSLLHFMRCLHDHAPNMSVVCRRHKSGYIYIHEPQQKLKADINNIRYKHIARLWWSCLVRAKHTPSAACNAGLQAVSLHIVLLCVGAIPL